MGQKSRKARVPNSPRFKPNLDHGLPFEAETPKGMHDFVAFKKVLYWVTPEGPWKRVREAQDGTR